MKKVLFLVFSIIFLAISIVMIPSSKAQDAMCANPSSLSYDDLGKCVDQLQNAKSQSEKATKPLENQIAGMKQRIAFIENDIIVKKQNIDTGYKNLAKQQEILNATIRDYYIKSYYNSPLLILLSANSATQLTQLLGYQKANADRDKAVITSIAITINDLQNKKQALEEEDSSIQITKAKLDKIVAGAKAYQATLSNQISQLSALQQQILAQRLSSLNIPLYAGSGGSCSSDIGKDPGFGTKFGFFSYGVPNRVGLNQYGAYGRANANQNADTILHAYYNFDGYNQVDTGITIKVNDSNGYNSGNIIWSGSLDQYLRRIYEVPSSWPSEALKAQVIAVASYVLAQTDNGNKSICGNTYCQVFQTGEKGGGWGQAISDIENANGGKMQVMQQGGQTIVAYFSSTHGGYIHSSGGDISSRPWLKDAQDSSGNIGSFSDLNSNAYDKNSPWFYCDWGSRGSANNTAWLKPEEVADIVNVILLAQKDSGTINHLYQTDKPNLAGTDTWDAGRVKQELSSRGVTPYNSISNISVSADFGSGKTTNVSVSGDAGSNSFNGNDFKNYFNLRAPANIQIVGPLYNVER